MLPGNSISCPAIRIGEAISGQTHRNLSFWIACTPATDAELLEIGQEALANLDRRDKKYS